MELRKTRTEKMDWNKDWRVQTLRSRDAIKQKKHFNLIGHRSMTYLKNMHAGSLLLKISA